VYGYISSETYAEDIKMAIGETIVFERIGTYEQETFQSLINSAIRVSLSTLIVDMDCANSEAVIKGLKLYRMNRSDVRIILFAPGKVPGDNLISQLVSIGIWDIVAPEIPVIENEDEEVIFDVWPYIKQRIENKATYGDAARWHYELTFSTNKENDEKENSTKEKISNRTKIITKTEVIVEEKITFIPNNMIAVINLSKKAGSSFLTLNLAKLLSENNVSVSILENPISSDGRTYLFDILGIELSVDEDFHFYSVPHEIKKKNRINPNHVIVDENLEYLIVNPQMDKIEQWSYEDTLKYLNSSKNNVKIIDIGEIYAKNFEKNPFFKLIQEVDYLLVMVNPLPHEMLSNVELLEYLTELAKEHDNIHFIINKWSQGIDEKFISKTKIDYINSVKIPFLKPELIYSSIYKQKVPLEINEIREVLQDSLAQTVKIFYPELLLNSIKLNKKSLLKRLLK
jgi:hypothetical protein